MELLGDVVHVESRFSPFGDSVSVGASLWYHRLRKLFWTHLMELLSDVGLVESRFGPFGGSVTISA